VAGSAFVNDDTIALSAAALRQSRRSPHVDVTLTVGTDPDTDTVHLLPLRSHVPVHT